MRERERESMKDERRKCSAISGGSATWLAASSSARGNFNNPRDTKRNVCSHIWPGLMRRQFSVYVGPSARGRKITIAGKRLRAGSRGYVARKGQTVKERMSQRIHRGGETTVKRRRWKQRVVRVYAYVAGQKGTEIAGEREWIGTGRREGWKGDGFGARGGKENG